MCKNCKCGLGLVVSWFVACLQGVDPFQALWGAGGLWYLEGVGAAVAGEILESCTLPRVRKFKKINVKVKFNSCEKF